MPQDNTSAAPITPPMPSSDGYSTPASQPQASFAPTPEPAPTPTAPHPTPIDDQPSVSFDTRRAAPTEDDSSYESRVDVRAEVASRITASKNVLIALSSDPSVDEMAAAIGLSLFLDKLGKRATAIYSGATPNALEFLKPEETFEPTVDTLQDFVIALNKDKADHLRYKLDGEYVKIFITPYKTRISESDLDFSYGDFNVDLVLALDVANGIDLDSALREHGRIMHDAVIINITTGNPGKFGEIEWSDKSASSVSEMIAGLLYISGNDLAKDEATAFLTGIVAATNRFSNAKTTPSTMQVASKLMASGANQQLVAKNITPDVDNELFGFAKKGSVLTAPADTTPRDNTLLDIEHDYERRARALGSDGDDDSASSSDSADSTKPSNDSRPSTTDSASSSTSSEEVATDVTKKEHTLLDDLKAAEQSLAQAGAETTPLVKEPSVKIESEPSSPPSTPTSTTPASSFDNTSSTPSSSNTTSPTSSTSPSEPILPAPSLDLPTPSSTTPSPSTSSTSATPAFEPILPEPVAATPKPSPEPTSSPEPSLSSASHSLVSAPTPEPASEPATISTTESTPSSQDDSSISDTPEKVIMPSADFDADAPSEEINKYGQMLQDALNSSTSSPSFNIPSSPMLNPSMDSSANPAATIAPSVPSTPDVNGVPDMSFMPMPGQDILPPPPTPPIDMSSTPSSAPSFPPTTPSTTSSTDSSTSDPAAFKIPGM